MTTNEEGKALADFCNLVQTIQNGAVLYRHNGTHDWSPERQARVVEKAPTHLKREG
jgi:hypothetical protein